MIAVRQFAIVDHEPIDRGPNAGVFQSRSTGDEPADLFILAEGTTPAGHEFAGHVVTAIGQLWKTLDLSLTGSLRAVFKEARRNVGDWNQHSLAKQAVSLGLTCVARRGDQVIIATAGPSIAYHVSERGLRAFLPYEDAAAPIDGIMTFEPTMERIDLDGGDNLLLLTAAAAESLDSRTLAGVMQLETADILRELFVRVRELPQATAVLLTPDAVPADSPAVEAAIGEGVPVIGAPSVATAVSLAPAQQPSLFVDGGTQDDALELARKSMTTPHLELHTNEPLAQEEIGVATLRRVSGDETLSRLANDHRIRASAGTPAPQPPDSAPKAPDPAAASRWRQPSPPQTGVPTKSAREHRNRSFSRALRSASDLPAPPAAATGARPVSEMASERRADADVYRQPEALRVGTLAADGIPGSKQGPLVRMRADMGGRWKSGGTIGGGTAIGMPPTWFVALAGITVFLVLIGFLVVPGMLEEESVQQQAALLDDAQQQLQIARVQPNPSEMRIALNEAHATALEALAYNADSAFAQAVVNEVAGAITLLDAITSPASVESVGSLEQFGDRPVAAARLVIGNTEAYILDVSSGAVIALDLTSGDAAVVYESDEQHARPIALAFAELAELGGPSLLIMDESGGLWGYSADTSLRVLTFAPPEQFTPTDIAISGQYLFVLDASAGVVHQFTPAGEGFDTLPSVALEAEELNAARRLMVDGEEFVTTNEGGEVRRFSGALPLLLSQAGIDEKLVAAESPHPFGDGDQLAVLDPLNDRIVILEYNGTFAQQYRHADFQGITAFAMRDGVGYVYSGGWLRKVKF